jgi:hypothetical protein
MGRHRTKAVGPEGTRLSPAPVSCPLCASEPAGPPLQGGNRRSYLLCSECGLIYACGGPELSAEAERARYLLHRNTLEDQGYVRFLLRLWEPVHALLEPGLHGLDYGSGPHPVLAELVRRSGFACAAFDPHFPEVSKELETYGLSSTPAFDFVLCSEVWEHFVRVGEEIARLLTLLRPGGILGVMTEFRTAPESFSGWPYTSDPTHRSFYHPATLAWIARRYALKQLWCDGERVVIFRRLPEEAGERPAAPGPRAPGTPPG